MKALVTGATGFLGFALATHLHSLGWNVTATGRNKQIGQKLLEKSIAFKPAEIQNQGDMVSLCAKQDYVFHCAAHAAPWGLYPMFHDTNVVGTQNIIMGCQKFGIKRLIHVSTPSIYHRSQDQINISENDPLPQKKVNAYTETKWLAEQLIDQAYQDGLPVITIRPRALFGPRDQTLMPRLLKMYEKGYIPLINQGKSIIDVTYIDNVVDALLLCTKTSSKHLGKKYNITNDDPRVFIDVITLLFQQLKLPLKTKNIPYSIAYCMATLLEWGYLNFAREKEPPLTRYVVDVLGKSQTLDISAAKKDLGYQPRISIEEGILNFVAWWRKNQGS